MNSITTHNGLLSGMGRGEGYISNGPAFRRRRFVEIFVSDPNPSVPMENILLHHEPRFLTELNDTELTLNMGLPQIVEDWNKIRTTIRDRTYMESDVMLEAIKADELRVIIATVVTL